MKKISINDFRGHKMRLLKNLQDFFYYKSRLNIYIVGDWLTNYLDIEQKISTNPFLMLEKYIVMFLL